MSPWEFACKWYRESEIEHSLKTGDVTTRIPDPADSAKFAAWLTHEYRLAMNKGIEIGRNWEHNQGARP